MPQRRALDHASQKKKPAHPPAPATPAPAAQSTEPPVAVVPPPPPPDDALGRMTPRGTVLGFLRAAEAQDYAKATKYLDSKIPDKQREELAQQLKILFDLNSAVSLETISRLPTGDTADTAGPTRDKIGTITTPSGTIDLLVDRIDRPGEVSIWLFSRETLVHVPAAYASTQHKDIADYFPEWTSRVRILSVPLWRWGVIFISFVVALIAARLLSHFLLWVLRKIFHHRMTPAVEAAILKLYGPTFALMLALMVRIAADYAITALGRHYWIVASILVFSIAVTFLLLRLINIATAFAVHRLFIRQQIERITVVGLSARLLKILLVIILFGVLLTIAGVNVSALFAGLGIGGIALALAAQKTLADLFGGISIVMRGAVRVNDYCTVAGKTGTVEEIGISALRIRTLDRSIISVPNSKVAEMELENFTMRDQFWLHQIFTLRFDTSHATVTKVLKQIIDLLNHRPLIDETTIRVNVIQLTPAGPQIEIFGYYREPGGTYNTFLVEQEKVILEIMRIVEEAGSGLGNPIGIVRLNDEKSGPPLPTTPAG